MTNQATTSANTPVWSLGSALASRKVMARLQGLLYYALLTGLAFVFLMPTIWMISTSLKEPGQIFEYPPRFLPSPVLWTNYPEAIQKFPFFLYLRNTLIVTLLATFGTVLSASLVAFGFARRRCFL